MKVDFDAELLAFNEIPLSQEGPVFLKTICVNALLFVENKQDPRRPGEVLSGEEMLRRYDLAGAVHKGGLQDLSPEDVVLIKSQIAKAFPTITVGSAYKLLNGK